MSDSYWKTTTALACESNIYRLIDMQASYNRDPNNKKRKESQNLRVAILVVDRINQMKREHELLMQHLHDAEQKLAALQEAKDALDSTHTGRLDGDISAMAEKVDTLKKQVDDVKGCIDNFTDIDLYSSANYAVAMPLLVNKLQAQHATNNAVFQKNLAQVSHKSLSATAANDPKAKALVAKLNKPVKGASGKTSTVLDVIKADVAERINTMKGAQTVEDVLQKHGVVPQPKPKPGQRKGKGKKAQSASYVIEQRDLQQMALRPVMFRELMLKQAISQALMNLQVQEGQAQKVPVRDVNAVFKMMGPVQELIQQQGIDARTMVVIDLRQEVGQYRVSVQNANNSVDDFDKQYQSAHKTVQQIAFNESQQHYENSPGGYSPS